ncbi:MAG: efflux RND transporter permease subunit [Planctomycetia bacterium]|nr:efflux RND transporter permease subunit [Planctomycetia bacterium]
MAVHDSDAVRRQPSYAADHANYVTSTSEAGEKRASWLVRVAVSNPYLVIVLCLLIVVIGYVSLTRIPVDLLPSFKTPAVQVLTLYPGMPTEIMERDITNRIERWTSQSEGIKRQESRTMIGVSIVKDFFRDDIDPNTAFAQVTSYAMSDLYYLPPGTIPPMVMLFDPSAPMPTALLAASSDVLDEKESYDLAYFNVRNMLSGSPGVIAPAVFGGRLRRIYVYLDRIKLQAYGLSLMDVQEAIKRNNLMIPTGNAKIGDIDYMIDMENMVHAVDELNQIVVKVQNGRPVYVKDVGEVKDTAAIQTNVVRIARAPSWESKRQVYIPIFRRPGSNTIEVVEGVQQRLPEFLKRLPVKEGRTDSGLNLDVVADQSIFVRNAISSLTWEGVLGAILASLMVLVFIGSVRSTVIIALTIPLSALAAVIGVYFTGNTLNAMTLGGLALVMGRLVDDPIVDIENTFRHLDMGKTPRQAALDSAMEIAMPVLVATITTVVVFFPVVFLFGMGKYLFTPLAISVAFAMFASYLLSRTLSPAYCAYFLKPHRPGETRFWLSRLCDEGFELLQAAYTNLLRGALRVRWLVVSGSLGLLAASLLLYPLLGRELFPVTDASQIVINVRAPSGTRIERTEQLTRQIENVIKSVIPDHDRQMIVTDIGVLYDWPAGYTANSGPMDGTMLVQLIDAHHRSTSSQEYAKQLRDALNKEFAGVDFAFNTGGMVSAALNFGLPAPIDIQIEGRDMALQYRIAQELRDRIKRDVPGAVDVRIQQTVDYPTIKLKPDRTKMAYSGIDHEDTVKNLMSMLNSSTSFDPAFWLDYKTGNHYFVGVTYKEQDINSINSLLTVPVSGKGTGGPVQLQDVVSHPEMTSSAVEVNHVALTRVIDIYSNVEGRDVGSVAADIQRLLSHWGKQGSATADGVAQWSVPDPGKPAETLAGYSVKMRGEVASMSESFTSLGFGMVLAVILIYLIMVAQFRSFLDPFIILFAVPLGLIGVLAMLAATGTTLNVQSLMGVIFMVGIAVSNSILLVEFANRLRLEHGYSTLDAAIESGRVRLRPILMTSLAAIVGLVPLALHQGEATMPLARAVIGGLSVSTALTVLVVPCLYVLFKGKHAAAPAAGP